MHARRESFVVFFSVFKSSFSRSSTYVRTSKKKKKLKNKKVTDAVVKVEVWDVVDVARKKRRSVGLKFHEHDDQDEDQETPNTTIPVPKPNSPTKTGSHTLSLDAKTIDVFKGTHAVILMVDPVKKWTWDYVVREV